MTEAVIGGIVGALVGSVLTFLITWRFSRTVKDALDDYIAINKNDEVRSIFVMIKPTYTKESCRIILHSGTEFLIQEIHEILNSVMKVRYKLVLPGQSINYGLGTATIRFSSIAFVKVED